MPNKTKHFLYKLLSMLSVVRGYNVLVIAVAQYLNSIFILSEEQSGVEVILDPSLFCLVAASAITIASGYIINNFYDSEKDLINRPHKTRLDRLVSQQTKLTIYFILNFLAVIIASYTSFRAVLFFSIYIFLIWFYSHKLKKLLVIRNIAATLLAIIPFFAVFIYYKNFDSVIFVHATFLLSILFMRELVKDLENMKGDIAVGNNTIPIAYGEKVTKRILSVMTVIALVTAMMLIYIFPLGKMHYYFWTSSVIILIFIILVNFSSRKRQYVLLHNLLKFTIVLGVFSILLIKPNAIRFLMELF